MLDRGSGAMSMSRILQAFLVAALVLAVGPLASADAASPVVTIGSPTAGSTSEVSAMSFTGTTSDEADVVTVNVYEGGSASGTPVQTPKSALPTGGAWSAQASALRNGTYTAVAEQVELGALEPPGTSEPVTFAIAAPLPAVSLEPVAALSNDATPSFTGAAGVAAGDLASVELAIYKGNSASGTPIQTEGLTPSGGSWSFTPSKPLPDGTYTAIAEQSDEAGNEGFSAPTTFTVDTAAPAVSLSPVPTPTKDSTPTFGGSLGKALHDEPAVAVAVYEGAVASGTPVASGAASVAAGGWSYTSPPLADGEYTVQAYQRDEAGNEGRSAESTFVVDTTPPAVSLEPVAALSNDATPSFGGAAGAAPGDLGTVTLAIYKGTSPTGTPVQTAKVASGGGSWSLTLPPTKALVDGTYTAVAEQSDEAGNTGRSHPSTFRVDTTPPKVTLVTPANGGSEKTENVKFSGKAGNEAGDGHDVTLNIYEAGSSEALQTVQIERNGEKWESNGPELPAGEYIAQALQSDTAGNTGVSSPHTFTIRTAAPVVTLATSSFERRGARLVTGTATPEFRTEPASGLKAVTLDVYAGSSAAEEPIEQSAMEAQPGGAWAVRPAQALPAGVYTAQARVEDFAANKGVSAPVVFTIDDTPPIVTLALPADGSSTGASETVTVAGTAGVDEGDQHEVTVQLFAGAGVTGASLEEVLVATSPDGSWSVPIGGLAPGVYTVRAQQSDDVGNRGSSNANTLTVRMPSAPPSSPAGSPPPPVASFTWAPTSPTVGQSVSLVSSSTDLSSAIGSYAWDLAGSGQFAPGAAVMTTSFATPGAHVVRLQVTDGNGLTSTATQTIGVTPAPARLMQPFPIVRIAGAETSAGAKIRLLTVLAPAGAKAEVACVGRGCRLKPESRVAASSSSAKGTAGAATLTFKRFERSLRAGVTLQIRVTKAGEIGKFTSFAIRRGKLPVRTDSCLQPTSARPSACPSS